MRKIIKAMWICILIGCITLISYATDLNELQEQKNNIQTQIDDVTQNLNEVDNELSENLKKIQNLDESINSTQNSLEEIDLKISNKQKNINHLENDLELVNQKYNKRKDFLDTRLIAMYETQKINYLDAVLNAKNISEIISTYYLISEITSCDIDLLELVEKEKKEIELKEEEISKQKEELENEQRNQKKTQIVLSNTKLLRENYLMNLSIEEQNLQKQIDEYNMQINDIENEIRKLTLTVTFGEDYRGGPMKWPIDGHYNITSNYGMRTHPITGVYKLHTGVDISATIGTNFTAIADGIVVKAEYNSAYGNMVIIDHGGGVQTLYAHGSEIIAKIGQEVKAGEVVLKVGSTGYSTGPHAHFEVRKNGNPVNPLDYVSISQ